MGLKLLWNWLKFMLLSPQQIQKLKEDSVVWRGSRLIYGISWGLGGSKISWWYLWMVKISNCGSQMKVIIVGTQLSINLTWIKVDFNPESACFQLLRIFEWAIFIWKNLQKSFFFSSSEVFSKFCQNLNLKGAKKPMITDL